MVDVGFGLVEGGGRRATGGVMYGNEERKCKRRVCDKYFDRDCFYATDASGKHWHFIHIRRITMNNAGANFSLQMHLCSMSTSWLDSDKMSATKIEEGTNSTSNP